MKSWTRASSSKNQLSDLREKRPVPVGVVIVLMVTAILGLAWHHSIHGPRSRKEALKEALLKEELPAAIPSSMLEVDRYNDEDHGEETEERFHKRLDELFATAQIQLEQVVSSSSAAHQQGSNDIEEDHEQLKKLLEDHVERHSQAVKSELSQAVGDFQKLHAEAKQRTEKMTEVHSKLLAAQDELSGATEDLLATLRTHPKSMPPGFEEEVNTKLTKLIDQTTETMALQDGLQARAQLGRKSEETANATRGEAQQILLELQAGASNFSLEQDDKAEGLPKFAWMRRRGK